LPYKGKKEEEYWNNWEYINKRIKWCVCLRKTSKNEKWENMHKKE